METSNNTNNSKKPSFFKLLGLGFGGGMLILFIYIALNPRQPSKGSPTNSSVTTQQANTSDCVNTDDYNTGYKAGHSQKVMVENGLGGTSDPDTYLENIHNIGGVSDCWKKGWYDAFKGVERK